MARIIQEWNPENSHFWENKGKKIANKNLWLSIFSLTLSFIIWQLWSVTIVYLPQVGFDFTQNQLSWLVGAPALSGATLRILYAFVVPIFGGRRWTAFSTLTLLIPAIGLGIAVQNPQTSYSTLLILALFCGFGSGNFSSSMANISFFYPKSKKGAALGLNAGLGNLGISIMQFIIPIVVGFSLFGALGGGGQSISSAPEKILWLQNAGFVWVPFILLSAILAWFGMNDIASMKSNIRDQLQVFKNKNNWYLCWLYLGTFGSFIGFAAAFPLLINSQFEGVDALKIAFLGPLIGALTRSVGGFIADKFGGARVTHWVFSLMIVCVFAIMGSLPSATTQGSFIIFFSAFMALFALTGIGNASTFMQVPAIFNKCCEIRVQKKMLKPSDQHSVAASETATVLGFIAAVAAYGGFFIPKSYGAALEYTGSLNPALIVFIIFYLSCIVLNWWCYRRKSAIFRC